MLSKLLFALFVVVFCCRLTILFNYKIMKKNLENLSKLGGEETESSSLPSESSSKFLPFNDFSSTTVGLEIDTFLI